MRSPTLTVNSLHEQGIDRLGTGLTVEARADDGLVEAISVAAAPQFTLAVQWHPEMRIHDSAEARAIFAAPLPKPAGRGGCSGCGHAPEANLHSMAGIPAAAAGALQPVAVASHDLGLAC